MREIKFKVWHYSSKKMSEPMDIFEIGDCRGAEESYFTEACEFLEYTGLKDKNGVEIIAR